MERRTRRRAFARNVYSAQKRLLAFLLAAAMILTNVGSDLSVAFAGTSESVVFELTGSELVRAVEEAIASGNEVTREDLDFTNGKVEQFEKLFFGEGKLYEAYPEFDGGGDINSELRIFVRLPEDADDMYMVTGDEEILFLYINNGDGTIRCSTNITRTVDGEEKVKKTKSVTIRSYESAFGDEEVNIIPDQPKQDINEATSSTADKENTNTDQSNQTNENTTPAEDQGAGDAAQDEIDKENAAAPDQNVTDGENNAQAPQEDVAAPDGEAQTPDAGNQGENAPEADAADQAAEPEGDTAEPNAADEPEEAAEPEGDTAEPEEAAEPEDNAEPIASVIRHYAPVVADNENGEAAPADDSQKEQVADVPDSADQAEAPNEDAAVEEPKAEEPKADEPAADAPAAGDTVTTPDGNTADGAVNTPDENGTGDAATAPDENGTGDAATTPDENGTGDVTAPQEPTDETPAPTPDTPAAGEDQNNGQPAGTPDANQPQAPEEELPQESVVTIIPPATPSEGTEQKPEEQKPEDNVSAATTSDLVGMGYCSTAKAYSVTLNQLKALDDFEGYKVTYDIAPKASARIVDGPRGVEEGGTLVFGVKNQIGYAIEAVSVNGETLEADSVTDNDDGSQTAWYTVPEVYEEQEVVVTMTESGEHPEFSATLPMSDGTIIHLYAEEGVLPAGVKAEASVVTGIEDVVKANVEAEAEAAGEAKEVVKVLSYNIDLLDKDGHKLDDQIWSGSVLVTFTGAPVEENSKEADSVEIMYVETTKEGEVQADVTAEDVVAVEAVAEPVEVAGDESVDSVAFEAEHFSTYTIVFNKMLGTGELKIQLAKYENGRVVGIGYGGSSGNLSYDQWYEIDYLTTIIDLEGYVFEKATVGNEYSNKNVAAVRFDRSRFGAYQFQARFTDDSEANFNNNSASEQLHFWYKIADSKVTFKAGSMGGMGTDHQLTSSNGKVTLPKLDETGLSNKEGRDFLGWSVSIDGRNTLLKPGAEYAVTKDTVLYAIWSYQVTFEANSSLYGRGESFKVNVPESKRITTPDKPSGFTNSRGWMFVGWHGTKEGHHNKTGLLQQTYVPNVEYPGEKTGQIIDRDITLYAVWLNTNVDNKVPAEFYIRLDGEMPFEPQGYDYAGYTARDTKSMVGTLRQKREINNNTEWVAANIKTQPTVEAIKNAMKGHGGFDPNTQEVVWYVIKEQDQWHVDGVIKDKEKHWLIYDPNGGSSPPNSTQHTAGDTVRINLNDIPVRSGYTFLGWADTKQEAAAGNVKYSSTAARTLKMPNGNKTIYAVWKANSDTRYLVNYYVQKANSQITDISQLKEEDFELYNGPVTKFGITNSIAKDAENKLAKVPAGYQYAEGIVDGVTEGEIVPDGSQGYPLTLNLYYVKDFSDKQTVQYRVEYYKDNTIVLTDSYTRSMQIWAGEAAEIAIQEAIDARDDKYSGYRLEGTDPTNIPASGELVSSGTVIRLYYVKDNFSYKVEYYKDSFDAGNRIAEEAGVAKEYGSSLTDDLVAMDLGENWLNQHQPTGYGVGSADNLPLTIGVEGNVIRVLYEKNSYGYIVEYYKDSLDAGNRIAEESGVAKGYGSSLTDDLVAADLGENWVNQHQPFGYGVGNVDNLPLIIGVNGNVIRVLYSIDENQRKDLRYTVNHEVGDIIIDTFFVESNVQVLQPDTLTRNLDHEADQNYPGYTKATVTYPDGKLVGDDVTKIDNGATIVVSYKENEDITVNYQSEDLTKGTVTLDTESIAPATGAPKGSEAKPADGYVFTHWTNSNGYTVATGEDNKHYTPVKNAATEVFEADTYTAHFTERGDLSYKVEYYFDGKLGETVTQDNVKFGTDIAYTTTDRSYNNQNYVFEKTEGPKTVGADSGQNLLKVYYTLDATGSEMPGTPDGVPDKFQITIRYEANANGSVSGTTVEVHTIQDFERDAQTGEITTVGPVRPATPNANVTTTANSRYAFDYWSIRGNADKKYNSTDDLKKEAFIEDVTFAANFEYVGGGSSGGNGGGNGGGPGSPSSKPEEGGPGANVTINPDDVPLAIMPDTTPADLTVIDDGEVPFAALPKTGQGSVKGTLTMMMSGILLAIAAINKKRKEEDNS